MSLLRFSFSSLFRCAAFVALLALFVPVVTAFVHHPAVSVWRICGMDQPAGGDRDNAPLHKTPSCPICQSLHLLGGGVVPPDVVVGAVDLFALAVLSVWGRGFLLRHVLLAPQALPRAPPVLV